MNDKHLQARTVMLQALEGAALEITTHGTLRKRENTFANMGVTPTLALVAEVIRIIEGEAT